MYNTCVLPVATYGLKTITRQSANRLKVTQRAMERIMLEISLPDKTIRTKTKVMDIIESISVLVAVGGTHS